MPDRHGGTRNAVDVAARRGDRVDGPCLPAEPDDACGQDREGFVVDRLRRVPADR